jgi:GNAT superfamily N-acetyltransferase
MEFVHLGSPAEGPTLALDHEEFAYAGKFRMGSTGKTVARDAGPDEELLGAIAYNDDHDREETIRLRYVTVRESRRGDGIGPRLLRWTAERLESSAASIVIAVNNPIAYEACYRAGFVNTGTETGIAELELRYAPDADRSAERYDHGFAVFSDRDLPAEQSAVIANHRGSDPPQIIERPPE